MARTAGCLFISAEPDAVLGGVHSRPTGASSRHCPRRYPVLERPDKDMLRALILSNNFTYSDDIISSGKIKTVKTMCYEIGTNYALLLLTQFFWTGLAERRWVPEKDELP